MLNITTKSTDTELTTTGALKARLFGSTSTSTGDDAMLSAFIKAASRWAENYVGYPLAGVQTYEETQPTYGHRNLMLSRAPLRSVRVWESTEDDGAELLHSEGQFRVESREAALLSRDDGWPWTVPTELELDERPLPGEESAPWLSRYTAGYTYNGLSTDSSNYSTEAGTTDTGRTLPDDIEEAVLLKARRIYMEQEGGEIAGEKLGDLAVNYRSGGTDRGGGAPSVLKAEELLLEPYRRIV
jgi:hypothetical protein